MSRSIRVSAGFILMGLIVGVSFAGGQYLRSHGSSNGPLSQQIAAIIAARPGNSGSPAVGEIVLADPHDLFLQVQQHVEQDYVDPIADTQKLGSGAVRSMLASLDDPKTRYYDPAQRKAFERQMNGEFAGIGATLQVVRRKKGEVEQRRLVVEAPAAGGPAAKAGIRAGDVITDIDGRWVIAYDPRLDLDRLHVRGMSEDQYRKAELDAQKKLVEGVALPRALDQLTQGSGKEVKLTLERAGIATPIKVTLKSAVTTVDSVEFREIDSATALLRVALFDDAAAATIAGELKNSKHRNLIVDLRDNPGGPITTASNGVLGAAVSLVAQLSPGGPVLTLLRKGNKHDVVRTPAAAVKRRRILVLVNEGTANVAEAVASALKERGATVIGAKTFGDGTLQKYYRLRNGGGMTINAGRLASPRDVEIAGVGVQPDIAMSTPASSTGDPALDRAVSEIAKTARSAR